MMAYLAFMLNFKSPPFHAYFFVGLDRTVLFIEQQNLILETIEYLNSVGVDQQGYKDVWQFLRRREWGGRILLSPEANYAISLMVTPSSYTVVPSYVKNMISMATARSRKLSLTSWRNGWRSETKNKQEGTSDTPENEKWTPQFNTSCRQAFRRYISNAKKPYNWLDDRSRTPNAVRIQVAQLAPQASQKINESNISFPSNSCPEILNDKHHHDSTSTVVGCVLKRWRYVNENESICSVADAAHRLQEIRHLMVGYDLDY